MSQATHRFTDHLLFIKEQEKKLKYSAKHTTTDEDQMLTSLINLKKNNPHFKQLRSDRHLFFSLTMWLRQQRHLLMTVLAFEEKYLNGCVTAFERDLAVYLETEASKKCSTQRRLEPLFTHSLSFFKMDANPQRLKMHMDRNVTSCSILQVIVQSVRMKGKR